MAKDTPNNKKGNRKVRKKIDESEASLISAIITKLKPDQIVVILFTVAVLLLGYYIVTSKMDEIMRKINTISNISPCVVRGPTEHAKKDNRKLITGGEGDYSYEEPN